MLDDIAAPNEVEHLLLSYRAKEKLQDLADEQCSAEGEIDMWPEHWEASGAVEAWRCFECGRLYVDPKGDPEQVVVYEIQQVGIPPENRSFAAQVDYTAGGVDDE
jgi:hypothetical protein